MYVSYHDVLFKVIDFIHKPDGLWVELDNHLVVNAMWLDITD